MSFPFYKQPDQMDCGATCLRMVAKHYERNVSLQKLRLLSETTKQGASLRNLSTAAEKLGFRTLGVNIPFHKIIKAPTPFIAFWNKKHFVVVYKIKKEKFYVADPAHGLLEYNRTDFMQNWIGENSDFETDKGIALLLDPTPKLHQIEEDDITEKQGFSFLYQYLFRYKKFLGQLIIGLLSGSLLQLIFPFLTQSVVDVGIQNQDINFIYLILVAQLFLFIGRISIELIRGWILLHLSTRINISLISDFFIKLMNLPIAFFDSKMTGDIIQRINDHQRIENLLTSSSLSVLFSMFNLIVFGSVLAWYSLKIFAVFFVGFLVFSLMF